LDFVLGHIIAPLGKETEGFSAFCCLIAIKVSQVLWVCAIVLIIFDLGFSSAGNVKKLMLLIKEDVR